MEYLESLFYGLIFGYLVYAACAVSCGIAITVGKIVTKSSKKGRKHRFKMAVIFGFSAGVVAGAITRTWDPKILEIAVAASIFAFLSPSSLSWHKELLGTDDTKL